MSVAKQIEAMLNETEAMLDRAAGDRLRDVFVALPMGALRPAHSALGEWFKAAGLNVTGTVLDTYHRLGKPIVLLSVPDFEGALPAGWQLVDIPLISGRSEHWMHAEVNAKYKNWVAK
jgi:hypothetical protein